MFVKILFLFFFMWLQQSQCSAQIPAALNSFSFEVKDKKTLPDDISFCIVDLKYKKPHLKICEFGQGVVSGFMGHSKLFGLGEIWKNLWPFLSSFKVPVFFINSAANGQTNSLLKATKTLRALGGIVCSNLEEIKKNKTFRTAMARGKKDKNATIAGILVASSPCSLFAHYEKIKKQYPKLLLLDDCTRHFVLNKLLTHLLFANDQAVEKYRPACTIAPCAYSPALAQEIIKELQARRFVIKPMNAFKGRGLVFVDSSDLDDKLKTILDGTTTGYWNSYANAFFLVESLEQSQFVTVDRQLYDATLRVAFGIAHHKGKVKIDFFGAYWKLPDTPMYEKGASLTAKYKSHINPKRAHTSAAINPRTYDEVKATLLKFLPHVYLKMIALRHDPEFLPTMRQLTKYGESEMAQAN